MKTYFKNITIATSFMGVSMIFSSFFEPSPKESPTYNRVESGITDYNIVDTQKIGFRIEGSIQKNSEASPVAKDVFVQKIKGDNNHLLMMARFENLEAGDESLAVTNNDKKIMFADNGKGPDKVAGDGLYTAIVETDVSEFRRIASAASLRRASLNEKPYKFVGREIVFEDPARKEEFRIDQFDNGLVVPITHLEEQVAVSDDSIKNHSLVVTALSVVEDPFRTWNPCTQKGNVDGPWTFKTLMKNLASRDSSHPATNAQTSAFVFNWLNKWTINQVVNRDTIKARKKILAEIITPWLDKSFEAGAPEGQLDMRFAPFKLTAIINRLDLRRRDSLGNINAGEGRFVFCLLKSTCNDKEQFTIILEYGVPLAGCSRVVNYAQEWLNLSNLAIGSRGYNLALQNITDQFTRCGSSPTKPNQSSLDQIRTNEIAITDPPGVWELREFVIDGKTHFLKQNPVGKEPAQKYNAKKDNPDVERMVRFVNTNQRLIKKNRHEVPLLFENKSFQGGAALVHDPPAGNDIPNVEHWDGTTNAKPLSFITNDDARHSFSLNTCSGCHGGETQTGFTHVDPVFFGTEATLSGFLTGIAGINGSFDFDHNKSNRILTVKDAAGRPAGSPALRQFNDLVRRVDDLKIQANTTCGSLLQLRNELMFQPLNMTH